MIARLAVLQDQIVGSIGVVLIFLENPVVRDIPLQHIDEDALAVGMHAGEQAGQFHRVNSFQMLDHRGLRLAVEGWSRIGV